MKKIILLFVFMFLSTCAYAQSTYLKIHKNNGETQLIEKNEIDSITFIQCSAEQIFYEEKIYNIVQIGNQYWLKENLDVGTMINIGTAPDDNGIIEKICYNNDPANCNIYGGLYDIYEAMQYSYTEGARGICPPGFHIPSISEFDTLIAAVSNDGNVLKAVGQGTDAGAGTNTSGFSGLLAGRWYINFAGLGASAYFWSSTIDMGPNDYIWILGLDSNTSNITKAYRDAQNRYSIRCIKD